MTERVIITDVGPRDGLQNQKQVLSPEQRLQLIQSLAEAGLPAIEAASFVSPKAVPAMAGAAEIVAGLENTPGNFSVLIPNMKGYDLALAAGSKRMEMVLYGTEGMAQANVRMSQAQASAVGADILARAAEDGVEIISTISVAFECPFDGEVDPGVIRDMTAHFVELGSAEVVIADTIGAANPGKVSALMGDLVAAHGAGRLGCHFHDTRAMGLANVYAALEAGVRRFDASIAGVGGCPFAPGASGNVATEDVVMMVEQMGYSTGIDLGELMNASALVADLTGNAPGGRARAWLERQLAKSA